MAPGSSRPAGTRADRVGAGGRPGPRWGFEACLQRRCADVRGARGERRGDRKESQAGGSRLVASLTSFPSWAVHYGDECGLQEFSGHEKRLQVREEENIHQGTTWKRPRGSRSLPESQITGPQSRKPAFLALIGLDLCGFSVSESSVRLPLPPVPGSSWSLRRAITTTRCRPRTRREGGAPRAGAERRQIGPPASPWPVCSKRPRHTSPLEQKHGRAGGIRVVGDWHRFGIRLPAC